MNKHWEETLIFICFVIVAAALWYGHAMTSVRTEVIPVNVQYTGFDPHIAFNDSLPATLSVEVRDAGQRIKTYYKDQPTITINLRSQVEEKTGIINITEEQLRSSVTSVLQGTSKLLTISPAALRCTYYRQESKIVHVALRTHITPAEEYQFAIEPKLYDDSLQVYGDPKILKGLDTIYTELYSLTDLKDTLSDWVELDLPSGVRSTLAEVPFAAVTERFTEKIFTLPITYSTPNPSLSLRLFPSEVSVTARCAIRDFNSVEASDINVGCEFPKAQEERLTVTATTENKKITLLRVTPTQVEYIVEQK